MTNDSLKSETLVLRTVDWRSCCPWLILVRVFRIACGLQILLLAVVGAITTTAGWRLSEQVFLRGDATSVRAPSLEERAYLTKWPGQRHAPGLPLDGWNDSRLSRWMAAAPADPVISLPYRMIRPFWRAFDRHSSWSVWGYYLFSGLWSVAVWGLLGGMITRIAVMQLGREERIDLWRAFEFGRRKWFAHLTGPLMPLFGVVLIAIPMVVLGLIMRANVGVIVGGIAWGVVLLGGFLMTLLLTALLFGWPLMWAAISAEGTDGFDAISRSYAYTLQRPLHYLFYLAVAAALGLMGWGLVWAASEAVLALCHWGTSWGTGTLRTDALIAVAEASSGNSAPPAMVGAPPWSFRAGSRLIALWVGLLRSLASGYGYSYFWCATAAIYLLLRRSVDATEMDEVYVDGDASHVFGLPKIKEDTSGSAEVDTSGLTPVEPLQPTESSASDSAT